MKGSEEEILSKSWYLVLNHYISLPKSFALARGIRAKGWEEGLCRRYSLFLLLFKSTGIYRHEHDVRWHRGQTSDVSWCESDISASLNPFSPVESVRLVSKAKSAEYDINDNNDIAAQYVQKINSGLRNLADLDKSCKMKNYLQNRLR